MEPRPIPSPGPEEDLVRWPQLDSWTVIVLLSLASLVGGLGGAIVLVVGMVLS